MSDDYDNERKRLIDNCVFTVNRYDKIRKFDSDSKINESLELELMQLFDLLIDWLAKSEQPYTVKGLYELIEVKTKEYDLSDYFKLMFNTAIMISDSYFSFEELEYVIENNLTEYSYRFEFFVVLRTIVGAAMVSKLDPLDYLKEHKEYFKGLYENLKINNSKGEVEKTEVE